MGRLAGLAVMSVEKEGKGPSVKNISETIKYLKQEQVAWLHFKVKD